MALLILTSAESVGVSSGTYTVVGTRDGKETVTVAPGAKVTLDASFNAGGDSISLSGNAGSYKAVADGTQVILTDSQGGTVTIPVGTSKSTVAFADASRELIISGGVLKLGNDTVTSTATTVTAGTGGTALAQTFTLTTGQDNLVGTAGDNSFVARTINGTNTFQDGDVVDGGAGSDVVYLDAVSTGNAMTPDLKNIESVVVRAQSATTDANGVAIVGAIPPSNGPDGNNMPQNRTVQIDAQRSLATDAANKVTADLGVTNWESSNSRSDVVIEDVRIGNTQKTKDVTITFRESDPGNVDFGLYFDQHSLRNTGTGSSALNIFLMDTAAVGSTDPVKAAQPLLDVNFNRYTFFQDNVKVVLGGRDTKAGADIDAAKTYPALEAAFREALKTATVDGVPTDLSGKVTVSLSGPVNMTTEALKSSVSAPVASSFLNYTGQIITLTSAGTSTITSERPGGTPEDKGGWEALGTAPPTGAIVQTFNTGSTSTTELVTSKIVLDDVGRGSTGGDLVVGGLSVGDTSTSRGVERFEITVEDSSKLQTINGTNNALREVIIVNGKTSNATSAYNTVVANAGNLTVNGKVGTDDALPGVQPGSTTPGNPVSVGNHDSTYGFTDVRLIDASAMTGQLAFRAQVTTDSLRKYVNLVDTQNVPTADVASSGNVNFNVLGANFAYTGGANNDTMVVLIDSAVAASTTLTGQSDFTIVIDGGAGNDRITTDIGGSETAAWLVDQARNANITVNGGDGNDTITTTGAGNVRINAGAGNDTVYTDNSGLIGAVWTVNNAAGAILADLQSNATASGFLYRGELTVTFAPAQGLTAGAAATTNGFGVKVAIPTVGDSSAVTQFHLNQAIKNAINNDPVLNKLLAASDGPSNTLTIRSLTDGLYNSNDLLLTVSSAYDSTSITDQAAILAAYKLFTGDTAATLPDAVIASGTTTVNALNAVTGMAAVGGVLGLISAGVDANGTFSTANSDNIINMGAGQDVLVLGTGSTSNDRIVFSGTGIKTAIVNFDSGSGAGADRLDFSANLTGTTGTTAITRIGTTLGADALAQVNEVNIISSATFTATDTFAGLTAAKLLTALNTTGNVAYASIVDGTLNAANTYTTATLVGGVGSTLVMVENSGNRGEYALFDVTFNGLATNLTGDFAAAALIGTVDFGSSLTVTGLGVGNFV